jgi:hypothetical protein
MKLKIFGGLLLSLLVLSASAQVETDPDWKESLVPPPPAFNKDRLIPLSMPRYVSLQFGIDPATLVISSDAIVRYVVVATNSSGSVTAMYEGIRCATWEVKTYARTMSNGTWSLAKNPPWQMLNDDQPSKHALALARQAFCEGTTLVNSVADIIKGLKS